MVLPAVCYLYNVYNIHNVRSNAYMTNSITTFTDQDRLEKFLGVLPETQFDDFLGEIDRAECSFPYRDMIEEELRYSKEVFAKFDNETVNEKYTLFNEALSAIDSFMSRYFFTVPNSNHYALHPEMKYSDNAQKAKLWDEKKKELDDLATTTIEAYSDFLNTAKPIRYSNQPDVSLPNTASPKIKKEASSDIDDIKIRSEVVGKEVLLLVGSEKINIGDKDNGPYKLWKCLSNPFLGSIRRTDLVFDETNPKDGKHSKNQSLTPINKKDILQDRLKELNRLLSKARIEVRLKLTFSDRGEKVCMNMK